MFIEDLGEIKAVAFDVDGTLYRSHRLTIRVLPYVLRHSKIFLSYRKARNAMHHQNKPLNNFKQEQLNIFSKSLKQPLEQAEKTLKNTIHDGLKKYFKKIKPCHGVVDLISELKAKGMKIALMSDLPPEQKGDIWGIKEMCDVTLWSEDSGAIKPSKLPFEKLAEELHLPAEEILYVGNNHKYDILGAKNAGMKTAWIVYPIIQRFGKKSKDADITFNSYNQLKCQLLKEKK